MKQLASRALLVKCFIITALRTSNQQEHFVENSTPFLNKVLLLFNIFCPAMNKLIFVIRKKNSIQQYTMYASPLSTHGHWQNDGLLKHLTGLQTDEI
jgi:hypothetical protein